jgi:hypothetical protein
VLVPINSAADRSNTPTSKSIDITVAPSPDPDAAAGELLAALNETITAKPDAIRKCGA